VNSSSIETARRYFRVRTQRVLLILAGVLFATIATTNLVEFNWLKAFEAIPKVVNWAAQNLWPDARAISRLPRILTTLLDTVVMAIAASVVAALAAIPFALAGSRTTSVNGIMGTAARTIASISRNIPVAAWALIFLLSFGQSSFTGFLALLFATFGFLTRVFMETIDEVSASAVEGLRATGASYGSIVTQAVLPSALPQMVSWELFVIEVNIRSATLVGLLTGSGIGFLFEVYYKNLQYPSAALITILLVVVVLGIEAVSNAVRRAIL
jgi:phosphonate transport system permease protein